MPAGQVHATTAAHEEAVAITARALAGHGPDERPLAIAGDGHDLARVLAQPDLAGSVGLRATLARSLWGATAFGEPAGTALLADIDENGHLRATAARARLHARVHSHIKPTGISRPMAVAARFSEVIAAMEMGDPAAIDLDAVLANHGRHDEEIATLVSLWNVICSKEHEARLATLDAFADAQNGPVAVMHWGKVDAVIERFLHRAARSNRVTVVEATPDATAAEIERCWQEGRRPDIDGLAAPGLHRAETMEEAARVAGRVISSWMGIVEGGGKVALVGHDRRLVRRIHSLCLRDGIHIADRTGWLGINLLVGKAISALASAPGTEAELALGLLQPLAHDSGGRWWALPRALGSGDIRENTVPDSVTDLHHSFGANRRMPACDWFTLMADATRREPLARFFEDDIAGERLCRLLHLLADQFAGDDLAGIAMHEARILLFETLKSHSFAIDETSSNIQLVNPSRLSSQRFDALLAVGADADNWPRGDRRKAFDSEVMKALRLPTFEDRLAETRRAAALEIAGHDEIFAVWHGAAGPSPYYETLGPRRFAGLSAPWEVKDTEGELASGHSTTLRELPARLSPTSIDTLMDCPYRFYAAKVLKLYEDRSDEMVRRDLFGSFVHEILELFHRELAEGGEFDLRERLAQITELAARDELPRDDEAGEGRRSPAQPMDLARRHMHAWEWRHFIDGYCDKIGQELSGTLRRLQGAEERVSATITAGGQEIMMRGTCDRIDVREGDDGASERVAIVDIKTSGNPTKFKNPAEAPQLAIYVAMHEEAEAADSAYWVLALKSGETEISVFPLDTSKGRRKGGVNGDELVAGILGHVGELFGGALSDAQPLPANGVADVCRHCPYGGMCRKDHWQRAASQDPR